MKCLYNSKIKLRQLLLLIGEIPLDYSIPCLFS